jgi:transaldolase
LTELAGADLVMSIAPAFQELFVTRDLPREERIDLPVPSDVIDRLCAMPEFLRAYDPDGMPADDFVGFGPTQRTLCQFCEVGWKLMENFQ